MDWKMPGLDGIATASKLKREPGMAHIPAVLLLSAYDLDDARRLSPAAVIDAYLEKPIRPSELRQLVAELTQGN